MGRLGGADADDDVVLHRVSPEKDGEGDGDDLGHNHVLGGGELTQARREVRCQRDGHSLARRVAVCTGRTLEWKLDDRRVSKTLAPVRRR